MSTYPKKAFIFLASRWKSRLSRRIVFLLFISFLVIEGLVTIPSVKRRERELLSQIKDVSSGKIIWLIRDIQQEQPAEAADETFLTRFAELQQLNPDILGGAIYNPEGKMVGEFGETPNLPMAQINANQRERKQDSRYDVAWKVDELSIAWMLENQVGNYTLILRHDSSSIKGELYAYILRIAGLVVIIAVFITLTLWIALEPLVITPILRLRRDLIGAGEAISQDKEPPEFYSASMNRDDELGEVIGAFEQMFDQISEAVNARKQAEAALQESLSNVEAYSQALDHELEKGREIQKNFLPTQVYQSSGWEIAAFFKPARQVAGDFYDTFELPGGYVGLVIADVCDKGVGAALFMALFRSLIRIFSTQTQLHGSASAILDEHQPISGGWIGESPATNLAHLNALQAISLTNNYVAEHHGDMGMFATVFFGVLCPDTGLLTYINGGHEPLLILNPEGGVREQLKSTGPAVGMLPDLTFKIAQTYIQPGEILLGYTDGVPEARASDGKFFTMERLLSMVETTAASATTLLDKITTTVIHHTGEADQFDDITLLAVRRLPL